MLACVLAFLAIPGMLSFVGCGEKHWEEREERKKQEAKKQEQELVSYLASEHKIRRLFEKNFRYETQDASWSGGFFLFVGGMSGKGSVRAWDEVQVMFAWDTGNETYAVNRLPLERCRIHLAGAGTEPAISFVLDWNQDNSVHVEDHTLGYLHGGTQSFLENHVCYATITCAPEDWPKDIRMPLDQEFHARAESRASR